jgi:hypothetical protein
MQRPWVNPADHAGLFDGDRLAPASTGGPEEQADALAGLTVSLCRAIQALLIEP